ncbi:sensor histidine kinase [Desulfuromonas thiophila]|uniref:histidine kinase n=1 Tax=Desulfuromonas thiophila TaxID=57664 RepID=A0A1G7AEM2_9BACT|nr:ATP-binding protein [Desulfuromonas thiophila]SDE13249.1 PAS domain S-box-containing protein [Desulfuromonas thiophila]
MNIRRSLRLNLTLSIIIPLAAGIVLLVLNTDLTREISQHRQAHIIRNDVHHLIILNTEMAVAPGPRVIDQWQHQSQRLGKELGEQVYDDASEQQALSRLTELHNLAERSFTELFIEQHLAHLPAEQATPLRQIRQVQLTGQLQLMHEQLEILSQSTLERTLQLSHRYGMLLLGSLLLLSLVMTLLSVQSSRKLLPVLKNIESGLKSLRRGNRSFRLGYRGRNELGELAQQFDALLDELHTNEQQLKTLNESLEDQVTDRTEELQAALENIRLSEERYRHFFELGLIGMATISPDGRILDANRYLCTLLGYDREEILQKTWMEATAPEDLERSIAVNQQVLAGERDEYCLEKTYLRKDGTRVVARISVTCQRQEDGSVDHFVALVQDISSHRQAQQQVSQAMAELQRSNEELEQFAYITSHDLQEPLRMITSYVQLLQRRYQGRLDEDADEFIGFVVEGTTRMKTMIQDLLLYSRAGREDFERHVTDLNQVLAEVLANLQLEIETSGATVDCDPLPKIRVVPVQAGQLLSNLLGNALKFRQPDRPPHIELRVTREQGFWQFMVQDNGIGIEPDQLPRLFVLFRRLHTRDAYPGTGIGLALCKKIVEKHGGKIWATSEPGTGSCFFFTWPLLAENGPQDVSIPN